jgi:hypothetical protein
MTAPPRKHQKVLQQVLPPSAMAGWDRGAPSQVVQNSLQSRLDAKDTPKPLGSPGGGAIKAHLGHQKNGDLIPLIVMGIEIMGIIYHMGIEIMIGCCDFLVFHLDLV